VFLKLLLNLLLLLVQMLEYVSVLCLDSESASASESTDAGICVYCV
jgi:hypothetical protein